MCGNQDKESQPDAVSTGPMMTASYRISGLLIVSLAIFLGWHATKMQFYTVVGPGGGFFPVILSILLGALGTAILLQTVIGPQEQAISADIVPDGRGLLRVGAVLFGMAFFVFALSTIGFRLTTFFLAMFLIHSFGRVYILLSLPVSAALSLGVHYVFSELLGIALPSGFLGF